MWRQRQHDSTDSSDSSSSEALSNEEYAQQAQAILLEFGTSFQQLGTADLELEGRRQQFADLVNQAEDEIQGAIDDFSALTPPPDAQEGHDQTLSALENFSSKLTDVSDAAESGDKQALQEAATGAPAGRARLPDRADRRRRRSLQDAGIDLGGSSTDSTTRLSRARSTAERPSRGSPGLGPGEPLRFPRPNPGAGILRPSPATARTRKPAGPRPGPDVRPRSPQEPSSTWP